MQRVNCGSHNRFNVFMISCHKTTNYYQTDSPYAYLCSRPVVWLETWRARCVFGGGNADKDEASNFSWTTTKQKWRQQPAPPADYTCTTSQNNNFPCPFRPFLAMVLYRIGIFMYRLVAFVFNTLLAGLDIIWVSNGWAIQKKGHSSLLALFTRISIATTWFSYIPLTIHLNIMLPNSNALPGHLQFLEPPDTMAPAGLYVTLHWIEIRQATKSTRVLGDPSLLQGWKSMPEVPSGESSGGTGCSRELLISN